MVQRPEPELDELYRELILDHYKRPRHRDSFRTPDVTAEGYNPVCGDEVEMELAFDGDRLTGIGMQAAAARSARRPAR